ncbi:MAG: ATP-binding protein [Tepidisphaeraceae bacterium]
MSPKFDLVSVVLQLSNCKSLEQITQTIGDLARDLVGADGITVVLRDADQCFYVEENAIEPLWKGKRFPLTACISGWCMLNAQQVVIRDIYQDSRIPHDAYRPTFVKSLAMTPIRRQNPVGSIGAYWATEYTPTNDQLQVLQALGDSAAMAFENSQLITALKDASHRKDAFLSMLAHELRNPLGPIRNGLHLLKLQGGDRDVVEQAADIMDRQVTHMARIVDDLLDVARINNGKVKLQRTRVDLAGLLRQCVEDRRHQIDAAGLSLSLEVPVTPIWTNVDVTCLTQVIGNLLDNARKYTPAGGKIFVAASVNLGTLHAQIDVRDTGIGIAPTQLAHVFESFMQADTSLDRSGGGLGLGLAIASGLVKLHDGTLAVHSDGLGHGAHFSIDLPNVEAPKPIATPSPAAAAINDKLRLLIIEDNQDAANTLQKLLKVCGYTASVAYDGIAGLDLALSERPDIVLCDIGLPKMDGYAVASALRETNDASRMRLIAITGYGGSEEKERSRTAGFDVHMVKPLNLQELLGHLRQHTVAN